MPENITTATDQDNSPISNSTNSTTGTGSTLSANAPLIFPNEVQLSGHFLKFTANKYSRETRGQPAAQKIKVGDVILPLPGNLSTSYSAEYNTGELNYFGSQTMVPVLQKEMADWAKILKQMEAHRSSIKDSNVDINKSVADTVHHFGTKFIDDFGGYVAYQMLDAFEDSEAGRAAQLVGGFARNPHLALLFRGVGFRKHRFEYNFVARNAQETQRLYDIIKFFKKSMLPSYSQNFPNHLFNYPHEFEFSFSHEEFLFKIGESVLTDFQINYHSTGQPLYFDVRSETQGENSRKAPVAVSIALDFTETSIVTQETIDEGR